jgi:hypothetical protein
VEVKVAALNLIVKAILTVGTATIMALGTAADTVALSTEYQDRQNTVEKEKSDYERLLRNLKHVAGKTENKYVKMKSICKIEDINCNKEGFIIYASETEAVVISVNVSKRTFTYQKIVVNKDGKWVRVLEPETYSATEAKMKLSGMIEKAAIDKAKNL